MASIKSKKEDCGNAIFIRGLAGSATGEQLESFFSGVGPIRRSFVVTDGSSSSRCKGLGFVHFALHEDAAKALQIFQGASLGGRRLKLDFARRRQRGTETSDYDGGLRAKNLQSNLSVKTKGKLSGSETSRTVVVKNRSPGAPLNSTTVIGKLGKDPSQVGFLSSALSADGTSMRLLFRSWPEAGAAAALIHCEEFDACVDALSGGRKCKLIVRNLPFRISPAELRSVFEQVAKVREISIPLSTKSPKVGHRNQGVLTSEEEIVNSRGFGFVEYFLAADTNRAIQVINGTKIGGRIVAVDLAIGKSKFMEKCAAGDANVEKNSEEELKENVDETAASGVKDNEENSIVEKMAEGSVKKPESTPEEMERTVFIRNLLFETAAAELRTAMITRIGPVEQVVIVRDPMTGRPRGTAFVRFAKVEDTEAAITPIPDSDNAQRVTASRNQSTFSLQGRDLFITRAVNRDRARNMVIGSNGRNDKPDRRNMRLAWIGHIKPESPEARHLTEADLGKRAKATKEKRAKLSSNPNAFVSDTRLCVRNLPKTVDEKFLKHLSLAMLRSLPGQSIDRNTEELKSWPKVSHTKIVRDSNRNEKSRGFGFLQFEEHRHALQALHKLNNNPKLLESLIELRPKALAIDDTKARLLRQDWGRNRRLIVEFSVEDSRQVAVLNRIKEKGRIMKEAAKEEAKETEIPGKKKRKSKNQNASAGATQQFTGDNINIMSRKQLKPKENEANQPNGEEGKLEQPRKKRKTSKAKAKKDPFDDLVSDYRKKLASSSR